MEIWTYNRYTDQRETTKVDDSNVTIGRDESNNVTLRSPFVSRKHGRIFKDQGSYYFECLGLNGATVATQPVCSSRNSNAAPLSATSWSSSLVKNRSRLGTNKPKISIFCGNPQ